MKRIAILGCENSHANSFLKFVKNNPEFSDVEVVGVYSNDPEASKKLNEQFGVPVLENYTDAVGKIDGLIITARHGKYHYEYAKPYIASGIPMFIDKPITVTEEDAVEFMRELRAAGVRITGGSSLKQDKVLREIAAEAADPEGEATIGGVVRAPYNPKNDYGDFYFYAQHLVEMLCEVFGRYPRSVRADLSGKELTVLFRYEGYDVTGVFYDGSYVYYIARFTEKTARGESLECTLENNWFLAEFREFYELLSGGEQKISYEDFISPVFIMNAIERSMTSGKEEAVRTYTV